MATFQKRKVCVLVKAQPQPSQKYQETVCVAGITDRQELVRLYPVRFRHLPPDQRFDRFDWIEVDMAREVTDGRPESHRVKEDSIRILTRASKLSPEDKVRIWKGAVVESIEALKDAQKKTQRSLGIVCPERGSMQFKFEPIEKAGEEDRETARQVYEQASLLEEKLKDLPEPEYVFRYDFTSGGKEHSMKLHDWEVETTYHRYKARYGTPAKALEKMVEYYQSHVPSVNPHFIMGNMHRAPWQFIIIGVLRTTADVGQADAQKSLFS